MGTEGIRIGVGGQNIGQGDWKWAAFRSEMKI